MAKVKYKKFITSVFSNRKERVQRGATSKGTAALFSRNQHGQFLGKKTPHHPPTRGFTPISNERFKFCECAWKNLTDCERLLFEVGPWGQWSGYGTPPSLYSRWMRRCNAYDISDYVRRALKPQGDLKILGSDDRYLYVQYHLHNENYEKKVTRSWTWKNRHWECTTKRTWVQDGITEIEANLYDWSSNIIQKIPVYLYTPRGGEWTGKIPLGDILNPTAAYIQFLLYHEDVLLNSYIIDAPIVKDTFYCDFEGDTRTDALLTTGDADNPPSKHISHDFFISPSRSFKWSDPDFLDLTPQKDIRYWKNNEYIQFWFTVSNLKEDTWNGIRLYLDNTSSSYGTWYLDFWYRNYNGITYLCGEIWICNYGSCSEGEEFEIELGDTLGYPIQPAYRITVKVWGGTEYLSPGGYPLFDNKHIAIWFADKKMHEETQNHVDSQLNWHFHRLHDYWNGGGRFIDDIYSIHWDEP